MLERVPAKGVLPFGHAYTDTNVNNRCKNSNDRVDTCAEYIMRSGWQIPDDYPW